MDNFTHTLIGVLVGESAARTAPASIGGLPGAVRRNLIVTTMAIGGNLPDLDLVYTSIAGGKLDYLLHHRGHTHTVLGALAMSAILLLAMAAWLRLQKLEPDRQDRRMLFGIALLAPLLHVAMDLANNYGVHPFWPLYNGWFYGDSIFIAEPLLWAACAPLVFVLRTLTARVLVAVLIAAGVALTFFSGLVSPAIASAYTALVGLMLLIGWRATPRAALASGLALWIGVTAMFVAASHIAGRRIDALVASHWPQATLYDRVLTPAPANPLCWDIILVQGENDEIALRRATLSLAPGLTPANECISRSARARTTAPLARVAATDSAELKWRGQVVSSRTHLSELVATDCRAAALMQFARTPWVAASEDALVLGDLRYDSEPALGFAEIDLNAQAPCPAHVPPWIAPRADMLR